MGHGPGVMVGVGVNVGVGVVHVPVGVGVPVAVGVGVGRKPLFTLMPDYPKIARRDRIAGEVQVCFDITRDGRTRRIAVRRSTNRIFEKPAIRAVRASTYVPLPDDAVVSGIKACRTFRFTLEPTVVEAGS